MSERRPAVTERQFPGARRHAPGTGAPTEGGPWLGVVIPTLEEEASLPLLLADLEALAVPAEIVVADGGSQDRTLDVARLAGARIAHAEGGRGRQMNAGARLLRTPWILFLHADSRLPEKTRTALVRWLRTPPRCEAAHFTFRLDRSGPRWSLIEWGQRVRERLTGLAYGDQGLLLSRPRYEAAGGIPELPLMEDVAMVRRLRRTGGLDRIEAPVITSSRRFRSEGVLSSLRNVALITSYSLGVPPRVLVRWYPPRSGERRRKAHARIGP